MSQKSGSGNKEIDVLRQILQLTIKKSEVCWKKRIDISGEKLSSETADSYKILIQRLYPNKSNNIDQMINKACRNKKELATHDVGFLYFPPFNGDDQEFVPILNFKADFSGEIPQIFFRVAMLRYDLDSGKLRIFGLRFETPHPKSNHDYCHVQFTRDPLDMATSNASESIEMIAAWSPQHVPCILAPAQGPASLLVWLIVGLYGKNVGSLFSARNFPKDYTEPLRYLKKFDAQ